MEVIELKIVVLAGGTSTERDVSLSSGNGVYNALKEKGHDVVLVDLYLGYETEKPLDLLFTEKYNCCGNIQSIRSRQSRRRSSERFIFHRRGRNR